MKTKVIIVLSFIMLCSCATFNFSPGGQGNLSVNREVTAKIRASDRDFFRDFDVYSAGVREYPTALLFDPKDEYHLPSRFWESRLGEDEIIYAIWRLDEQHREPAWGLPFEPRALTIVNLKGQVVGYIYTSLNRILMDRKKDGRVTVFLPVVYEKDGKDDEREIERRP